MAKEHRVTIGGKERVLVYRMRERLDIERHFRSINGKRVRDLLHEDALGIGPTGQPDIAGGSIEAQAVFLWAGLRHADPQLTIERVLDWMGQSVQAGQEIGALMIPVQEAVYLSGILGVVIDLEEVRKKREAEAAIEAGGDAPAQDPQHPDRVERGKEHGVSSAEAPSSSTPI